MPNIISPFRMRKFEKVRLIEYDPGGFTTLPQGRQLTHLSLQFWPDTLSDSKDVNYEIKTIPGTTQAIHQWISSGNRSIGFTASLISDIDIGAVPCSAQFLRFIDPNKYIIDINKVILWLRQFIFPADYNNDGSVIPPKSIWVYFPNTVLGYKETVRGLMLCRMKKCDINYKQWFPDGTPRYAVVDLAFDEIMEGYGADYWTTAEDLRRML